MQLQTFHVCESFQCVASGMWPLRRSITAQIDMQLFTPQEVRECAAVSAALYQPYWDGYLRWLGIYIIHISHTHTDTHHRDGKCWSIGCLFQGSLAGARGSQEPGGFLWGVQGGCWRWWRERQKTVAPSQQDKRKHRSLVGRIKVAPQSEGYILSMWENTWCVLSHSE